MFITVHRIIGRLGNNLDSVDYTIEEKPTVFNSRFILKMTEKQFITEIWFADGSCANVAEPVADILAQIDGRIEEPTEPEIELQPPSPGVKI